MLKKRETRQACAEPEVLIACGGHYQLPCGAVAGQGSHAQHARSRPGIPPMRARRTGGRSGGGTGGGHNGRCEGAGCNPGPRGAGGVWGTGGSARLLHTHAVVLRSAALSRGVWRKQSRGARRGRWTHNSPPMAGAFAGRSCKRPWARPSSTPRRRRLACCRLCRPASLPARRRMPPARPLLAIYRALLRVRVQEHVHGCARVRVHLRAWHEPQSHESPHCGTPCK